MSRTSRFSALAPHRTALLCALSLAFVLLSAIGCGNVDYRPQATGPNAQITVVMDSTRWDGPLGDTVRKYLAPYINTLPVSERSFDLRHEALTSERIFNNVKKQKNVVFIAPLSDSTREASFMRTRLSEKAQQAVMNGQTAVVPKPNLWRQDQRVYFVTAASPEGVIEALQNNGTEMRETFYQAVLKRKKGEMFEKGRQRNLEDTLMAHHGFALNVQHDYQIAIDTTHFVWLRRLLIDTRRELFVYYKENADPSTITPEWIYDMRDSLTKRYLRGNVGGYVRIDYRRPLKAERINFLDRYGYEVHGLWHMVGQTDDGETIQYGGGGPFVNYTFYDQPTDRIYMIDGMVFAPNFDKREFLRQMEVIARTFRTQQEVQSRQQATASRTE